MEFRSYVRNCLFVPKAPGETLFHLMNDHVFATLDGYAIIPREEYDALRALDKDGTTMTKIPWACLRCSLAAGVAGDPTRHIMHGWGERCPNAVSSSD